MTYWEKPLVWLLTLLIDGTLLYTFSCVAFCQRPCARDWSLFLAATMVIDGINMLFLHGQFSGWSLLQGLRMFILWHGLFFTCDASGC